jgi:hypothetical protein
MQQIPKVHCGFRAFKADAHHAVYGHDNTPHQLHVVCPTCGSKAEARNSRWVHAKAGAFEVRCPACLYRRLGLAYSELPPLYYRVSVGRTELWAWNRDHLMELLSILNDPHVRGASIIRVYVRREWLIRRRALAKAINTKLRQAA